MKCIIQFENGGARERRRCYRLGLYACLLAGLLVMGCRKNEIVYRPTQDIVPSMSSSEAKRTMTQLWQRNAPNQWIAKNPRIAGIKFKRNSVELTATDTNDGCISTWRWVYLPNADPYVNKYSPPLQQVKITAKIDEGGSSTVECNPPQHFEGTIYFETISDATGFVNAFYVLKRDARAAERAAEAAFADSARKYREMPVKPPLPEDVQKCRIMAEDAIHNKRFEKAADYYVEGLEIEPLWPEGQFNAALLYGELKDYGNAALHMKRYLELVPNARDAREAREKMYLWEGKARETVTK